MINEIIEILEDIIEEDGITDNFILDKDIWDSLNIISFIAAVNSKYGIVLDSEKLSQVNTVSELIILVESESS